MLLSDLRVFPISNNPLHTVHSTIKIHSIYLEALETAVTSKAKDLIKLQQNNL
jgi:hypothetical protein